MNPPPHTHTFNLHPKDQLEVCAVTLGHLIAEFPRIIFALLRNMKRKLMVGVEFVPFVPTTISNNGERKNITVLRKSHAEIIFMRTCLAVRCFFI